MSGGLAKYLEKFPSVRVAVVGDYIADEFIYGETSRISREAPVLVLDFQRREVIPGGGGNAAPNAAPPRRQVPHPRAPPRARSPGGPEPPPRWA